MECILPFGMLCMSAWRMMFVKMVFAVCMSSMPTAFLLFSALLVLFFSEGEYQ